MACLGSIKTFLLYPWSLTRRQYFKKKYFFFSWSDALLFLFNFHQVQREEYLLLPNFLCQETVLYWQKKCRVIYYQINDDLSVNKDSYFSQIKLYRPRVILNFSFVGFELTDSEWTNLKSLINEKTIIIEDYAHRLFAELPLKQTTNHYFIDSIRKHCSLLGAHLLNFNGRVAGVKKINHYKLACIFYRFWQNRLFDLAYIFSAPSLYQWGFKFFLKLNNLIGEPVAPTTGTWFSFLAYNFLNLKKIRKNYNEILLSYNEKIALLPDIYIKKLNSTALIESGIATYYPLLVSKAIREQLLTFLETDGIFAFQIWNWEEKTGRKELNRELHESLIVFPLSVLITKSDIDYIFEKMKTFFANLSYVENKNE